MLSNYINTKFNNVAVYNKIYNLNSIYSLYSNT